MSQDSFSEFERVIAAKTRTPGKRVVMAANVVKPGLYGRIGEHNAMGRRYPDALVIEARAAYAAGEKVWALAKRLGVHPSTLSHWVKNRRRNYSGPTKSVYLRRAKP